MLGVRLVVSRYSLVVSRYSATWFGCLSVFFHIGCLKFVHVLMYLYVFGLCVFSLLFVGSSVCLNV